MTKKESRKKRKIYSKGEVTKTENTSISKGQKPKTNKKKNYSYGGGRGSVKGPANLPKKRNRSPDIKTVERNILQYIIGQDKQVRQILTAIYRAMQLKTIKSNILIIGSSGTGKTATITQIAKRLHIPYTIEDATKYTQEGYYGADVNDMIYNLIENANQDIEKAQNGMIIIDEIDKKAGHGEHDVSGTEVLKSLLKIIEGTKIKIPSLDDPFETEMINFDTKNIIIIFLGAFSGLEEIRDKRLNINPLGFQTNNTPQEKQTSNF